MAAVYDYANREGWGPSVLGLSCPLGKLRQPPPIAASPAATAADLDNMFNKLTLSAPGLMAAVTGPMVFFAVSKPAVSLPTGPVQATPDRSLTEVFQFNITPELDHAALAAGGHRAGPGAIAGLPRALDQRHGGERRGRR